MICAKCGANNPDASAYCGGCGSPMPSEPNILAAASPAREDLPTERGVFDSFAAPISQAPQPTPGEVFQLQPQEVAGASVNLPVTPGNPGGVYPEPGAASVAPQGWPSGAYPAQAAMPTVPQSWPSGAYPPIAGSGSEFPAGAYPAPGAAFTSGAYPTYPQATPVSGAMYPGQQVSGVYPTQGAYPGQMPPVAPQQPSKLIQRLPLWAFLFSILLVAVVLALLVFFTGADWAAGAGTAGVVAIVVGGILLIAFGVRSALGMLAKANPHRVSQIVSSILLMLILFALGAVGFTQQSGIHVAQARSLEGQANWPRAIQEYQDGGYVLASSADLARTYDKWGEELATQTKYSDALVKFNTVISGYTQNTPELARAKDGAASAYFNLANQELTAKNYSDAVTNFNQLITTFPDSPQAKQAHAGYARALWGQGQAELASSCSSALTNYQQLSTQFSDTPEGQQAKAALALPQPVKGHFTTTIPSGANTPQVGLTQGVSADMSTDAFYAILAKSPVVNVNSDGTFTFPSINQGSYYLVWGVVNNSNGNEDFLVGQRYPATVGPLCAFNYGDISESFPTA